MSKIITLRVNSEELEVLEKIQKELDIDRSEAIRLCINLVNVCFINEDMKFSEIMKPFSEIWRAAKRRRA